MLCRVYVPKLFIVTIDAIIVSIILLLPIGTISIKLSIGTLSLDYIDAYLLLYIYNYYFEDSNIIWLGWHTYLRPINLGYSP